MDDADAQDVSPAQIPEQPRRDTLPLLLVLFPLAVALARTPLVVGMVFAAFCFLSWQFRCHKAFLLTLGIAFALSLLLFTGATIHYDVDNYLGPQIRLFSLPFGVQPDGFYSEPHCRLPQGLAWYGAALFRLTGSIDLGQSAFFLFFVAAWRTLRVDLTRLQAALLLIAPSALPSVFNLMPDGCVYLLLILALFALRRGDFWLPLAAAALASILKVSAWVPTALIALLLLWRFPRRFWQIGLVALATLLLVFPTLHLLYTGGLNTISSDFSSVANDDARTMGWFARILYVHVGHWTTSLHPHLGPHLLGVDGLSSDALGPIFRLVTWASLAILVFCRKRLAGWWSTLALAWLSVLIIPTVYVGYARYVPLLWVAGMLPLVLRFPKVAILPTIALLGIPLAMLGWRLALSTEAVMVANHATAVQSNYWNVRETFRHIPLTQEQQPLWSGSLLYSYSMPEGIFPPMPRRPYEGLRKTPMTVKAAGVREYALREWLPWMLTHPHTYLLEIARFRWRNFVTLLRGSHDGLPPPARQ